MRVRLLAVIFLSLASTALCQRRGPYWSLGGFGNVLFPGTGRAPNTPPGGITGPHLFPQGPGIQERQAGDPPILSFPVTPIPDEANLGDRSGLEGDEKDRTAPVAEPPLSFPPVIDHEFASEENAERESHSACEPQRDESTLTSPQGAQKRWDDKPTIYLLAFKDGSVAQSLGYWVKESILYYVSVNYALNQVSLVRIDEKASERLNAERGIDFNLIVNK